MEQPLYSATFQVFGSTPQAAAEELNKIVGVYSRTASSPEIGSYDPNTLDNNWPTCREKFAAMFNEIERKNPLMTLEAIYDMTRREFYRQYGFIPDKLTARYFLREARSVRRPAGRKPNVGVH